jgi:hypothetical protein
MISQIFDILQCSVSSSVMNTVFIDWEIICDIVFLITRLKGSKQQPDRSPVLWLDGCALFQIVSFMSYKLTICIGGESV